MLAYAPAAARQAAATGAHRAAALFALALPYAETLPPADRAALVEAYAGNATSRLIYLAPRADARAIERLARRWRSG